MFYNFISCLTFTKLPVDTTRHLLNWNIRRRLIYGFKVTQHRDWSKMTKYVIPVKHCQIEFWLLVILKNQVNLSMEVVQTLFYRHFQFFHLSFGWTFRTLAYRVSEHPQEKVSWYTRHYLQMPYTEYQPTISMCLIISHI